MRLAFEKTIIILFCRPIPNSSLIKVFRISVKPRAEFSDLAGFTPPDRGRTLFPEERLRHLRRRACET